jgi:hypothetical protein
MLSASAKRDFHLGEAFVSVAATITVVSEWRL